MNRIPSPTRALFGASTLATLLATPAIPTGLAADSPSGGVPKQPATISAASTNVQVFMATHTTLLLTFTYDDLGSATNAYHNPKLPNAAQYNDIGGSGELVILDGTQRYTYPCNLGSIHFWQKDGILSTNHMSVSFAFTQFPTDDPILQGGAGGVVLLADVHDGALHGTSATNVLALNGAPALLRLWMDSPTTVTVTTPTPSNSVPSLATTRTKGNLALTWSSGGILQSASFPTGPWSDVLLDGTNVASPYVVDPRTGKAATLSLGTIPSSGAVKQVIVPAGNTARFFRVDPTVR